MNNLVDDRTLLVLGEMTTAEPATICGSQELTNAHENVEESSQNSSLPSSSARIDNDIASSNGRNGIDSGYGSQMCTPQRPFSDECEDNAKFIKKRLQAFDSEIPESFRHRFSDLKELFDDSLHQYIQRKHRRDLNIGMIAWRLKALGETKESARPWIVVLCGSKVSKTVRKYFNKPLVKEEYQPGDTSLPSFRVQVCEWPLRELAAFHLYPDDSLDGNTLCGRRISIFNGYKTRFATLGGIVKVVDPDGTARFLAMTVGHVLGNYEIRDSKALFEHTPIPAPDQSKNGHDELQQDRDEANNADSEDDESMVFDEDEFELNIGGLDSEDDLLELDGDEFELEIGGFDNNSKTAELFEAAYKLKQAGSAEPENYPATCPVLSRSSEVQRDTGCDLDWALFHIPFSSMLKPNTLIVHEQDGSSSPVSIKQASKLACRDARPGTRAYVLTSHGVLPAVLQPSAFIKASHARRTTEVFVLRLDEESGAAEDLETDQMLEPTIFLDHGDSGSWVVDQNTGEVYGYVVASDLFQDTYVVPLHLALTDMQNTMVAAYCGLPSSSDWAEQAVHGFPGSFRISDSGYVSKSTSQREIQAKKTIASKWHDAIEWPDGNEWHDTHQWPEPKATGS